MDYVYSLGICEANRRTLKSCQNVESIEERIDQLQLPPWWHQTKLRTRQKWPDDPPKTLVYQRIHKFSDAAPWCSYVLEHKDTVVASYLNSEDLARFEHQHVTTNQLFVGCVLSQTNKSKMDDIERRVARHIKFYARVVPYSLLQEKCQQAERGLIADEGSTRDLCNKIQQSDAVENIADLVEGYIKEQRLRFLSWVQDIRGVEILDVKKEVQRNDWFTDFLTQELSGVGLHSTTEFSNKYSIFGKSRPDFVFYKPNTTSWIKVGIIMQQELINIDLYGAAVEFKIDISQDYANYLPQAFANMVRVSNNVLVDGLKSGKVVDTITIYGLMTKNMQSL